MTRDDRILRITGLAGNSDEFMCESATLRTPLRGSIARANYKAAIYTDLLVKSGLVGSHSRITQAVEGAASYAVPGDMSRVRNPVRSTAYRAATPGGGSDNDRLGRAIGVVRRAASRAMRCPVGYENGGQFTSRNLVGCGKRLFDIPGGADDNLGRVGLGVRYGFGRIIGGGGNVTDPLLIRTPRTGGLKVKERDAAVGAAIKFLSETDAPDVMIRRDAVVMRPLVSIPDLSARKYRNNPDMDGATMVLRAATPNKINDRDIALLSNGKVSSVVYALPGGSSLRVDTTRDLTVGDRRRINGALRTAQRDDMNVGDNLRSVVEKSNGSLAYREDFKNIKAPNDLIEITKDGKTVRQVRRWVYETYLKDGKDGWQTRSLVAKGSDETTSSSLNDAIVALDAGKDPQSIPPKLLPQALRQSSFERRQANGVTEYVRDGKSYVETPAGGDYGHINRRVASDVHSTLGLTSPKVAFLGEGKRRRSLIEAPDTAGNGTVSSSANYEPGDVVRAAIADYLLDKPDRRVTDLVGVGSADRVAAVLTNNTSDLTAGNVESRMNMSVDDFYPDPPQPWFKRRMDLLTPAQREILFGEIDEVIKAARKFNWDDYVTRLSLDGELSTGEKAHLAALRRLFETRLKNLSDQRGALAARMGLS